MLKKLLLIIIIFSMATTLEANDIILKIERKFGEDTISSGQPVEVYISGEKVTIQLPDQDKYFIYRGDKNLIWLVDPNKKALAEITETFIDSLGELQNELFEKIESVVQDLPPTQKAMAQTYINQTLDRYEGMLGTREDTILYEPTSQTKNINGFPCKKWQALRDSTMLCEIWITDWKNIQYSDEIQTAYTSMTDFVNTLKKTFNENVMYVSYLDTPFNRYDPSSSDGMPISSATFDRFGNIVNSTTLQSIEKTEISNDTFSPPAGYELKKLALPELPEFDF